MDQIHYYYYHSKSGVWSSDKEERPTVWSEGGTEPLVPVLAAWQCLLHLVDRATYSAFSQASTRALTRNFSRGTKRSDCGTVACGPLVLASAPSSHMVRLSKTLSVFGAEREMMQGRGWRSNAGLTPNEAPAIA